MALRASAALVAIFCAVGGPTHSQPVDVFRTLEITDPKVLDEVISQASYISARNAQSDTAVITAAPIGNLIAIEAGADINALDCNRRDILNITITSQNSDLARHALALGADLTLVTSIYEGGTTIYRSVKGAVEIVEMLIAAVAPVNQSNNLGRTAMLEVAVLGDGSRQYVEIAKMLIEAGPDPNIEDRNGLTAFDHATRKGHFALAEVLSSS